MEAGGEPEGPLMEDEENLEEEEEEEEERALEDEDEVVELDRFFVLLHQPTVDGSFVIGHVAVEASPGTVPDAHPISQFRGTAVDWLLFRRFVDVVRLWFRRFVDAVDQLREPHEVTFYHCHLKDAAVGNEGADAAPVPAANEDAAAQGAGNGNGNRANVGGVRVRPPMDWTLRSEDLERLFGAVLPGNQAMTRLKIRGCLIPSRYFEMFASRLPTNTGSLAVLGIDGTPLDARAVSALVAMLRRNVRLRQLSLRECGLSSQAVKDVCDGAAMNEHLRALFVSEPSVPVQVDTFARALSEGSRLETLGVLLGFWSHEKLSAVIDLLKTNVRLRHLRLPRAMQTAEYYGLLEDLLSKHNFTVATFGSASFEVDEEEQAHEPVASLLRRNKALRAVNGELAARQYRVTPPALWPAAMGRISRMPTLLQRFLRRGNADGLALHLQGMASSKRTSTGGP